ncbi:uncharacterized protein YneF (UPF0154 family) [Anaeroplasma bactoclasticum]|jgi:uncharacterized protein YneF (UPF0154 family)|uniref:Uncharacterized protein YneF (UPF0154 family) n=1 Tax=Anaeroplasma bactoclasticum TaxID=2088 RepID=A0A397S0F5_9MOLU|nr:YneF family protein [Anaeroplasma bactoclasticum]RIA75664.1 uncharacterized protein YneF (UPF0154 family) [Anaeroplasma bactoclasticum]
MFLEVESGHMDLAIWQFVLIVVFVLLATAIATFFLVRKLFEKELKKNPPVSEAMIRAMFQQMGRTPSEKQVRAVMKSMNDANEKEEAKKKEKAELEAKRAAKKAEKEAKKKEAN